MPTENPNNLFNSRATEISKVYYEQFYQKVFYGGVVNIRLKELIRLRLAGISGCKYCISVDVWCDNNRHCYDADWCLAFAKNGLG